MPEESIINELKDEVVFHEKRNPRLIIAIALLLIVILSYLTLAIILPAVNINFFQNKDPYLLVEDEGQIEAILNSDSPDAMMIWEEALSAQNSNDGPETYLTSDSEEDISDWEQSLSGEDTDDEVYLTATSSEAIAAWEAALPKYEADPEE